MSALLLIASLLAPAQGAVVDRVAAVVNDEVIALSEVYDLGAPYIQQKCGLAPSDGCRHEAELEILDSLIQRALMEQELEKQGMGVSQEDRDRAVSSILKDNGYARPEDLRAAIEESGLTWDTYLEQISEQLLQMKFEQLIASRVMISDAEVLDLYKRTARTTQGPPLVQVEATIWPAATDAQEALADQVALLRAQLALMRDGQLSWEQLPSALPGSMQQPMGTKAVRTTDLAPALAGALVDVPVGGITEPVMLNGALVLLRVNERKDSDVLPFEQVQDQLRERVRQGRIEEEVEQWYLRAKRQAALKIVLDGA
ncbi:MAG: peptidyl-prolyl cis-trans isomerase [Deltaproteobacteria bacterium]|nr:peptidyl-prolyl cis-trans isomerase [Deltaproteobacteria bacterium]